MSRWKRIGGIATRLPLIVRTVRPMRARQLWAQLRHVAVGVQKPVRRGQDAPRWRLPAASTRFMPPPDHVRSTGPGRIELLTRSFDLSGTIDWESDEHGPLFAYHLHQQEYLRLPAFSPARRGEIMLDWIRRHPSGVGWDPHPISLRLLCWGKLLADSEALEIGDTVRTAILASMADQAETLRRGLEVRLQANHLLSNLIAVVWAGLLLEGEGTGEWLACAAELEEELERQIHADGGHEERSPMYHALLLENLLDLLQVAQRLESVAPDGFVGRLESVVSRMLGALALWTLPDGQIALFADSGFGVAADPDALFAYADRLGVAAPRGETAGLLRETGYARLESEGVVLIASVAGPAPPHQPGHAHCDALSFELALGSRRVVSDTGLFEYVPGERRDRARATASHATARFDDREQAETWAAHRIGGRPEVEILRADARDELEAACRGWGAVVRHRRVFRLGPDATAGSQRGACAEIVDRFEGRYEKVELNWPVDPGWQVEIGMGDAGDRPRATLAWVGEASSSEPGAPSEREAWPDMVEIDLDPALEWRVEPGPMYPRFGVEVSRPILTGRGEGLSEVVTRIRARA